MSLSSALSIALSGLQVSTVQLQVASSNIANAQDPGYTTETATVSSVALGASGNGGASITGYTTSTNAALSTSVNNATSNASYYSTQNGYLQEVQAILDSSSSNPTLSNDISQFQSAWTQYAAAPESSANQAAVIQAGTTLAQDINTASSAVLSLQQQVTTDTQDNVTSLNTDLSNIASLNQQIASATNAGQPTGDLIDQRSEDVTAVAAITGVTVLPRSDNQIALYTPGGTLLLDGPSAQNFTYNGSTVSSSSGQNVTDQLTGGSLQAQLQFVANSSPSAASPLPGSEVIRKLNEQLSALAGAFTSSSSTFATAYSSAATGSQATSFFQVQTDSNGNAIPSTLVVNPNLVSGTATLPETNVQAIGDSFASTANYTAAGLSIQSATYSQLGTAVLSTFQQAANTVSSSSTSAGQQQAYYQQALTSATGVDVDSELVQLTTLQNSYAASAHVITTITQMISDLEAITTTA